VRRHPVLEDQESGSGRKGDVLAHMKMPKDEIIHVTPPREIHGELVQWLIGASEGIFLTLRHPAFL